MIANIKIINNVNLLPTELFKHQKSVLLLFIIYEYIYSYKLNLIIGNYF